MVKDYIILIVVVQAFLFAGCSPKSETPDTTKMNILHIVIEDWSAEAVGCYGNNIVKTPNVDALAKKGMMFTRAYCQATVCNPSRASFTTGTRPDRTNVYANSEKYDDVAPKDLQFITQILKQKEGIHTAQLGKLMHKWHHTKSLINTFDQVEYEKPFAAADGTIIDTEEYRHYYNGQTKFRDLIPSVISPIPARTWTYVPDRDVDARMVRERAIYDSLMAAGVPDSWPLRKPFQQLHAEQVGDDGFAEEHSEDGILARVAAEMIKDYAQNNTQFFLSVGLYAPHTPLLMPKKFLDMYRPEDMPLTPAPHSKDVNVPDIARRNGNNYDIFNGFYPEYAPTEENQKKAIAGYYAASSHVDAQVGVILKALEETGLAENTIVVLFADHGFHLGEHGLWSKFTLFEQSTRVPMVVYVPGMKGEGKACDEIVELVDFVPTLCDLWDIPQHNQFEGTSFAPLLDKPEQEWKKAAFSVQSKPLYARSVRTKRYKYCEYRKDTYDIEVEPYVSELYDLEKDPWEQKNVVDHPDYAEVVKEHYRMLRDGWKAAKP